MPNTPYDRTTGLAVLRGYCQWMHHELDQLGHPETDTERERLEAVAVQLLALHQRIAGWLA